MPELGLARGGSAGRRGREPRAAVAAARVVLPIAFVALVVAVACVIAGACGGAPDDERAASPAAAPRAGGTLDYPLLFDVGSLLPGRIMNGPEVAHQIYEGLVAYEKLEDGRIATVPCLAESWEASRDATVWTFHLRRGVRFQAPVGREVTAADVVAVYRFSALARNQSQSDYLNAVISGTDDYGNVAPGRADGLGVSAPDRYTVRFTLKRPCASFPDILGGVHGWIWPVDYLERVGRRGFEERPVGTGPFVVSRRVRGRYIDLVRNPDWWNASSGRPYLESVHFVVFESVAAELQAFQQGLVDVTWVPKGQVAASRSLPQVGSGEWTAVVLPTESTVYACFNMDDPVLGGDDGLALRQAVDCALDRRALVDAVSDGVYVPQTGLVPPVFAGWEGEQPAQPYDPVRARALYAEAGSPRLTLVTTRDRRGIAVAESVRDACAAAGIAVTVSALSWEAYVAAFEQQRVPAFFLAAWQGDYPSYDNFLYEPFLSSLSAYTLGTRYADPDVDRLLTLARSTADPQRRLDLSRRAAHEILADKPVLPLFQIAEYRLLSSRVGGFSVSPVYGVDAWKLWVQ